jgi:hypothetical protein
MDAQLFLVLELLIGVDSMECFIVSSETYIPAFGYYSRRYHDFQH